VALGRLVLSKRERVIALEAYDKGLLGTTLRYPYEVRKAEDYFCDLPDLTIASDMRKLAEHILDSKAAEFDPAASGTATRRRCWRTSRPSRPARFRAQADLCPDAAGDQSHGGAAPQRRRGHQRSRAA